VAAKQPGDDTLPPSFDGSSGSARASDSAFDRLLHEAAKVSTAARVITPGMRLSNGRFEITRRIGQGGMGVVFEAFDTTRREKVALKTMSRMEARDVYQFKNEFRALCDVSHPNLVRLHELSTDDELWFFTMELVEGERFDEWLRPSRSEQPDIERVNDAMSQLVQAVAAIHAAGKLHRDLKPSNVLVTPEGRVVVLDFGLAIDPEQGGVGRTVMDDGVSGTPAYMAPEQAAGRGATAASDWYAVGVMLFEALTGQLPFTGKPQEIIFAKQRDAAPFASTLVPDVPAQLDELCTRLLDREPSARPDATELQTLFAPQERNCSSGADGSASSGSGAGSSRHTGSGWSGSAWSSSGHGASLAPEAVELLGRDGELQALRDAFEATLSEQAVVVFVSGESGMGKSALCETFLQQLRTQGRATVLSGRCYERENVPFKGFDSLLDDLSRHLRKLSREEAVALLPRDVYALTRLFPVLGRVEVVAEAPKKEVADPIEQRRRAYAAFGELLTRMRDRGPLCLYLDDVQWLDADAVVFMRALLVHPEPVPLLLLMSHRSEHAEENQALLRVRDAIDGNSRLQLENLSVAPLSQAAVQELAQRLLPEATDNLAAAASAVAKESGGSPFFVGELCRFVVRHGTDADALTRLSLQAALADHLSTLAPPARRLLEHTALAGQPLPATLLLQAAEATHAELDLLRTSRLLRLSNLEGDRIVECYHDRVRETVSSRLDELERVRCYAALAGALHANGYPDAELLATCFEGAGQRSTAAEHYARAADQAMASTAFMHAADLYEKALALGSFDARRVHTLTVAQADALAEAGRAKQAGELFLRAAAEVEGVENRTLRRRAAEGLIAIGHSTEGMALFHELFRELGLKLPSSPGAALRHLLWAQLRLRLRGLDYVPREAGECSLEDRERLSLYYTAHWGVTIAEPLTGAGLDTDYLLYALRAGVSEHVAFGMAYTAFNVSLVEPAAERRVTRMLETALRIAGEHPDPRVRCEAEYKSGLVCMNRSSWKRAQMHLTRALEIVRGNVRDAQWLLDNIHGALVGAEFYLGDWRGVVTAAPNLIEQAYSRDRIYVAVMLTGGGSTVAWLSGDDVTGCQRAVEYAKAQWHPSNDVQLPDLALAIGVTALHVYRGEPQQALAEMETTWTWLTRSPAGRSHMTRFMALFPRGQAAVAVLRQTGDRAARSIVRDSAKRLAQLRVHGAIPMKNALDAGLALHAGNTDLAAQHLRAAVAGFDETDMAMYAAATRRRLGELIGGDEGEQLLAQGDATMRAQRVKNLDAITEALCPGCRAP